MPFVKIDCGIIHSSLWAENSDTKVCWFTLLLLADATGFVRAAASAISREAGITADAGRKALDLFMSPDDESRTPDNNGKRIEKVDGGYKILNYSKYREKDYTAAERMKRYRNKSKDLRSVTRNGRNETVTLRRQKQKHTKEEEAHDKHVPPASFEDWISQLESKPIYAGMNIRAIHSKMTVWCEIRGLKPTLRRLVNWLNKEDKPLPSAKPQTYGKQYLPPPREVSDSELQKAREDAHRETEALRKKLLTQ